MHSQVFFFNKGVSAIFVLTKFRVKISFYRVISICLISFKSLFLNLVKVIYRSTIAQTRYEEFLQRLFAEP